MCSASTDAIKQHFGWQNPVLQETLDTTCAGVAPQCSLLAPQGKVQVSSWLQRPIACLRAGHPCAPTDTSFQKSFALVSRYKRNAQKVQAVTFLRRLTQEVSCYQDTDARLCSCKVGSALWELNMSVLGNIVTACCGHFVTTDGTGVPAGEPLLDAAAMEDVEAGQGQLLAPVREVVEADRTAASFMRQRLQSGRRAAEARKLGQHGARRRQLRLVYARRAAQQNLAMTTASAVPANKSRSDWT